MEKLTLRTRHISVCARLFGEKVRPAVEVKNKGGRPSKAAAKQMPDNLEEAHKKLDAALYEKALAGDRQAIRDWKELNAPVSENPMSCEFYITPYNIEDKSLSRIAMQADVPVVMEILEGIRIRLEADGAPEELKGLRRAFQIQLDNWMRKAYAPKDV